MAEKSVYGKILPPEKAKTAQSVYREILPSDEARTEKKRIRREVLARRDALTREAQQRASCLITERLLGHQWFYRSNILLCYVSYGSELDTRELLREALRLGKQVFVPRVLPDHLMDFFQIASLEELQPGFRGIPEPLESARVYAEPSECAWVYRGLNELKEAAVAGLTRKSPAQGRDAGQALMLMPGVAFDLYGRRLGYGGGYYDRYLAAHPQFLTYSIGIGHSCQLVEELPMEKTDCKPYQVILV